MSVDRRIVTKKIAILEESATVVISEESTAVVTNCSLARQHHPLHPRCAGKHLDRKTGRCSLPVIGGGEKTYCLFSRPYLKIWIARGRENNRLAKQEMRARIAARSGRTTT